MAPRVKERTTYIRWFEDISIKDVALVGGKNASLGEMYRELRKKGVNIPNGFAITANAYWHILEHNHLKAKLKKLLTTVDARDLKLLRKSARQARRLILSAELPPELTDAIVQAYRQLSQTQKQKNIAVAVRSSATAEDLPEASFAGQQETYLQVRGEADVVRAVHKCLASLFTDRAISYRQTHGFDHLQVALSVSVQAMVAAGNAVSGVMFTLDTESGFRGVTLIDASYGLGEYVVKGRVSPDQFYVFKDGVRRGKPAIISRALGSKEVKLVAGKTRGTKRANVKKSDQNKFCLTDAEIVQLTRWGMLIEDHYGVPQDIEWAKDGKTGQLFIVQARPETVKARTNAAEIEQYILKKSGEVLVKGVAVGQKIGAGAVRIIDSPKKIGQFKKGDVLVTRLTDPDWEPLMRMASAIVTEQGGKTSHAAIVSREMGVPCVVGAKGARSALKAVKQVTVSCVNGDEGMVYRGVLPFEVKRTKVSDIPAPKTKVMMNVGDPTNAFSLSFLPHDGVGLARQEFIFSNFIRIHPLALVHYTTLKDKRAKKKIKELTAGYRKKTDYGVEKLAEGIGRIAAAFYPQQVVLRLSDFKSNEYAALIGGAAFEPHEENPMLGWRGASRYYSRTYKPAFKLECEAIKRARETWGLDNITVMVPFCRTPEEGEKVLKTMEGFGLKREKKGLQVYVMCEIPANVVLAEEYARLFDGFSIGSNDLTQLTLGLDRDSGDEINHLFNENDPAVRTLIAQVIKVAHKHKKKVGICGQAPSDNAEFTEFLVREGIDSISLNPDVVIRGRERIAYTEKTVGKTGSKTNKPFLSLVVAFGLLAAAVMAIGAGCTEAFIAGTEQINSAATELSPADIRQKVEENISKLKEEQLQSRTSNLQIKTFTDLTLSYPSTWSVEQWNGGVTLHGEDGEYLSVFPQLLSQPVPTAKKTLLLVGGRTAYAYNLIAEETFPGYVPDFDTFGGGLPAAATVVTIPDVGGETLEINSNSSRLEHILGSIAFGAVDSIDYVSSATHWDVREKRHCVDMVTYAKPAIGSAEACRAFLSPCNVPEGWYVCDADDL